MSSIVEGFNYDIFISYRQKDNKRDGWVTQFIENLKDELESTFKEEIGVYFDINPHDGLLETHDVGASLKDKLKCLIFIPVVSRTYCDPNSFAWQYELKAFIDLASRDQFGLKIKTTGGNVANRILPVLIHELDPDDRKVLENELGGFIRGIDFIYEEQGVNRPLMSDEDHPDRNLHKVYYRNQINKTANAIKDIISGIRNLQKPDITQCEKHDPRTEKPIESVNKQGYNKRKKLLVFSSVILSAAALCAILYLGVFSRKKQNIIKDSNGKISIAINNFDNLTGDTTLNSWTVGIAQLLIYNLGNSPELEVQNSGIISMKKDYLFFLIYLIIA